MKLKNTLALSLAAVMAAGLTACGSGADTASPAADSTAAKSTEAAADTAAPDGDGDPTTLTVAMECAYAPTTGPRTMMPTALWRSAAPATTPTATTS